MAEAIASVLGWGVLIFGAGALAVYTVRRARTHGILVPLLVGFALRLVVMLVAHVALLNLATYAFS